MTYPTLCYEKIQVLFVKLYLENFIMAHLALLCIVNVARLAL